MHDYALHLGFAALALDLLVLASVRRETFAACAFHALALVLQSHYRRVKGILERGELASIAAPALSAHLMWTLCASVSPPAFVALALDALWIGSLWPPKEAEVDWEEEEEVTVVL